jgi:hypothetical protein
MTVSDPVSTDRVLITCPACGASESADSTVIVDAPMIVCRECGGTWPAAPRRTKRRRNPALLPTSRPRPILIEAERRPFVAYSDGAEKAWIAKMEGDILPEEPQRRRLPSMAAGMAAVLLLAVFFGGREAAVAALPDLAGLYGAFGLPVNLDGLALEDVTAELTGEGADRRILVHGSVRNIGNVDRAIPPLTVAVYDSALTPSATHGFNSPADSLPAGGQASFLFTIESAPEKAAEVVVRFRRRGEVVQAAAGEWPETDSEAR